MPPKKNNYDFIEIDKLEEFFIKYNLPYLRQKMYDGEQIILFKEKSVDTHIMGNRLFDAVLHMGSYGHEKNLLEIMGFIVEDKDDSVEGFLTAEEIIKRLKKKLKLGKKVITIM